MLSTMLRNLRIEKYWNELKTKSFKEVVFHFMSIVEGFHLIVVNQYDSFRKNAPMTINILQ